MRIMCLNGWGGRMHERLLAYLLQEKPDVLCLQEVVHSPQSKLSDLTYRDGDHVLPQRANFFRDVCDVLPGYTATFCPAAQGILWDRDQAVPSNWGLATFVRGDIPITAQVQGFVHKSYGADGYGDHPRSRSAHAVRLHDHKQNRAISIGHMHGLRDLAGKMDTPERFAQAHAFLGLCNQITEPGDIRVLCGDFNVEKDSTTLDIFRADGLVELVTARGFKGTRNSLYQKSGRFADYMLVDTDHADAPFQVIYDPEISDHCPLVLDI